jgi:hypothetical protein
LAPPLDPLAFDWIPKIQWFVDDVPMAWEGSAFVSTPGNVPSTALPDWITTVFVQVASGLGPPGAPLTNSKIAEMRSAGLRVEAWAWFAGPTQPGGGEPEEEARWHAECARAIDATVLVANLEEYADAHGNQADPRFKYPSRYLAALDWPGPLGLTTTPLFASDMTDWIRAGACFMPQAFPLENHCDIDRVVRHGMAWGWQPWNIRPLLQCYETNNERPDPIPLRAQADEWGVGVVPYVIEQACDDDGMAWLTAMQECIIRPTSGSGGGLPDVTTIIGPNHGIVAACNRLRYLDPKGTKLGQTDGKWDDISTLPPDLATWGAWDKLQRTLTILASDHDEA